MMSWCSLRNR